MTTWRAKILNEINDIERDMYRIIQNNNSLSKLSLRYAIVILTLTGVVLLLGIINAPDVVRWALVGSQLVLFVYNLTLGPLGHMRKNFRTIKAYNKRIDELQLQVREHQKVEREIARLEQELGFDF